MVYYRKYRPQKIGELDSIPLQETLFAALANPSSIAHAFLFTGPKGLGKTSTARIVAKVVNCEKVSKVSKVPKVSKGEKPPDALNIEPCNKCNQCISITNGSNLDILEIDGASNRGIDEIRDLREKIRLSPIKARKKVYIIDEVHMLTTDAFNALLKTLEEPPDHAMFILCTTELQKVPATILSRCFLVPFKKATEAELIHSLLRIAKGENLEIDNESLQYIASLSEGSFRDGAKILEELVSLAKGDRITKELLESKYKVSSIKYYDDEFLKALSEKNMKQAIESLSKIVEQGIDMKYFLEQLLSFLHDIMLKKVGIEKSTEWSITNYNFQLFELQKLVDLFSKAHQELKYAVLPQLPLELAIIEYIQLSDKSQSISQVTGQPKTGQPETENGKPRTDNRKELWGSFIDVVKSHNHTVAGVLRGCSLKSIDDSSFVIETAFQFHKEKLSEKNTITLLEQAGSEISGKKVRVLIELRKQ